MEIIKINSLKNRMGTNSYLLIKNQSAILIDAGIALEDIEIYNIKLKAIFLTHCHFDHIMFLNELCDFYQCDIYISENDKAGLFDENINMSKFFKKHFIFKGDTNKIKIFKDNEEIKIDDFIVKCLLTPGHTAGSTSFLINDNLFSGDTLFAESVGRTDFATSSPIQQKTSLKKLENVDFYNLYPGHSRMSNKTEQINNIKFWLSHY